MKLERWGWYLILIGCAAQAPHMALVMAIVQGTVIPGWMHDALTVLATLGFVAAVTGGNALVMKTVLSAEIRGWLRAILALGWSVVFAGVSILLTLLFESMMHGIDLVDVLDPAYAAEHRWHLAYLALIPIVLELGLALVLVAISASASARQSHAELQSHCAALEERLALRGAELEKAKQTIADLESRARPARKSIARRLASVMADGEPWSVTQLTERLGDVSTAGVHSALKRMGALVLHDSSPQLWYLETTNTDASVTAGRDVDQAPAYAPAKESLEATP